MGILPFATMGAGMGSFPMAFPQMGLNSVNQNKMGEMGNQMPFFWNMPGYQMPARDNSKHGREPTEKEYLGKRASTSKKIMASNSDNDYPRIECPVLCKMLSDLDISFDSIDKTFYLLLCKKSLIQCNKKAKNYKMKELNKYLLNIIQKIDEKLLKHGSNKKDKKKETIDDVEKTISDLEL